MTKTIFRLNNVHYSYLGKFPALCGIDMEIFQGEKITIIGANGSGKSTLLHLLDALIFPDKGSIFFLDKELTKNSFNNINFSKNFRKKVGLVFQNPDVQLFCPTVKEDILFGPAQLDVEKETLKNRLEKITAKLNLNNLLYRTPHQLSIGEKRKVAIATTLAIDTEIIILDEPTAALDPLTASQIIEIIIQANREGKTIITATQDLNVAGEISDKIYLFNSQKKIADYGNTAEILNNYQLLQENNIIKRQCNK